MRVEKPRTDVDILGDFKDGNLHLHDLPPHLKWQQPQKRYTVEQPYQDPGINFTNSIERTDQSQTKDCDINLIVKRAQQTGVLPGVDTKMVFADISDVPSYQEARQIVIDAQNQFMSLDAFVRKKFENDPEKFLEFIGNPKNAQEAAKLGLATIRPKSDIESLTDEMRASNKKLDAAIKRNKPPRQPSSDDDA